MEQLKGFILALVGTSVSTALIDGFVPEGGLKRFVKYLLGLMIVLCLISPLKGLISAIPTIGFTAVAEGGEVEAYSRANAIVARRIEDAVCDKFSLEHDMVSADCSNGKISLNIKWRPGLIGSDFVIFVERNFGLAAEVRFYE